MATVDDAVRAYIMLRDRKEKIKDKHREELKPVNDKMQKIEAWLLRYLTDAGLKNAKTEHGTVYTSTLTSATVEDWEALVNFVVDEDLFSLLEHRVSKTAVSEYKEATGDLPPGVSIREEVVPRIRR